MPVDITVFNHALGRVEVSGTWSRRAAEAPLARLGISCPRAQYSHERSTMFSYYGIWASGRNDTASLALAQYSIVGSNQQGMSITCIPGNDRQDGMLHRGMVPWHLQARNKIDRSEVVQTWSQEAHEHLDAQEQEHGEAQEQEPDHDDEDEDEDVEAASASDVKTEVKEEVWDGNAWQGAGWKRARMSWTD